MKKEIIVNVAPDGAVSIEAVGFKGGSCEAATKAMEEAMGKAGERKKKPEFYQTEVKNQRA